MYYIVFYCNTYLRGVQVGGLGAEPPGIRAGGVVASPRRNMPLKKSRALPGLFLFMVREAVTVVLGCLGTEGRSIPALWGCSAG